MANKKTDWKQMLLAELRRDKKKTALLAVLAMVAVIVVGRSLVGKSVPASAHGAPDPVTLTSPVYSSEIQAVPVAATAAPKPVKLNLKSDITRDLFTADMDYFPPEPVVQAVPKPATMPVDEGEVHANAIRAQATRSLLLQSTVCGVDSVAIINGLVLRLGDWITGFKVVEITSRTCTIEKDGVRVTLEMQN